MHISGRSFFRTRQATWFFCDDVARPSLLL
jgi:hypothetical protein